MLLIIELRNVDMGHCHLKKNFFYQNMIILFKLLCKMYLKVFILLRYVFVASNKNFHQDIK